MNRLGWIFAVGLLALGCKEAAPSKAAPPTIPAFVPLHTGAHWTYGVSRERSVKVGDAAPASSRRLETHTVEVLGPAADFGEDVWRVRTTVSLDTSQTDQERFQHRVQAMAIRDDALVLVAQWGVGRKSERRDLIRFDPPVTLVQLGAATGASWSTDPLRIDDTIAQLQTRVLDPEPVYLLSGTIEDTRTLSRSGAIHGKLLLDGRALSIVSGQHEEKDQYSPDWTLLRREVTRTLEIRRADGRPVTLTETVKARLNAR